jgi:hypothetical protein
MGRGVRDGGVALRVVEEPGRVAPGIRAAGAGGQPGLPEAPATATVKL